MTLCSGLFRFFLATLLCFLLLKITCANDHAHDSVHSAIVHEDSEINENLDDEQLAPMEEVTSGVRSSKPVLVDADIWSLHYLGNDKRVVVAITRLHTLYRSPDFGVNWENQEGKIGNMKVTKIMSVKGSDGSDSNVLLVMGQHGLAYLSLDMGETFSKIDIALETAELHQTSPNHILGTIKSPGCEAEVSELEENEDGVDKSCFRILVVSEDGGLSWKEIKSHVHDYFWHHQPVGINKFAVFAVAHRSTVGHQHNNPSETDLLSSTDYFHSSSLVAEGAKVVHYSQDFIYIGRVSEDDELLFVVNRDNLTSTKLTPVQMPRTLRPSNYNFLASVEGSSFLFIEHPHSEKVGDLYISDESGSSFTLSHANIATVDMTADFARVASLEGVYVVNVAYSTLWDDDSDPQNVLDTAHKQMFSSMISFSKGAFWQPLDPPHLNLLGKPYSCHDVTHCYLHIHVHHDNFGGILSCPSAAGLILATGNVGPHLSYDAEVVHTYLSRDAGKTWFEIAKGSHHYDIGNHGGVIVMANDRGATDSILYSFDEGITFHRHKISDHHIHVDSITMEDTNSGLQFLIIAHDSSQAGVVVHLDFSGIHEAVCSGEDAPGHETSDYESWMPSDHHGKCLLGHTITYIRRKRDRLCHINKEHKPIMTVDHCVCTEFDFECDFGYKRDYHDDGTAGKCVVDHDVVIHPTPCVHFHSVSKGYKKIAGDTCTGGDEFLPVQSPCPVDGVSHTGQWFVGLSVIIVIVVIAVLFANRAEVLRRCAKIKSKFDSYDKKKDYGRSTAERIPFNFDDDDIELDNEVVDEEAAKFSKKVKKAVGGR